MKPKSTTSDPILNIELPPSQKSNTHMEDNISDVNPLEKRSATTLDKSEITINTSNNINKVVEVKDLLNYRK